MISASRRVILGLLAAVAVGPRLAVAADGDPLPSWADGEARRRILDFVTAAAGEGGPGYILPADRIAVFDNDGCLWCEKPVYFQLYFALDRVKAMAPDHPEWKDKEPFKSVLAGDLEAIARQGEHALLDIVMETHAGLTVDQFKAIAAEWLATARHPTLKRPFRTLIYQPMLELLAHLRANGFQTWIVSGGGVEFLRAFAEDTYGIPPQQVVGSSIVTEF